MSINLKTIIDVQKKIKSEVRWTETSFSQQISERTGTNVFVKYENRQHTGSFKVRGSYNKLLALTDEDRQKGVIAMSAGNHAQGLAFSARKLSVNSNIVMPIGTPFTKIRRTKNFGGNVFLKGNTLEESYNYVQKLIHENGFTEVHPYNDIEVIKGQGTLFYEMLSDISSITISSVTKFPSFMISFIFFPNQKVFQCCT